MKITIKHILIICLSTFLLALSAQAQSVTTQYVYDENGRLKAVIAPNGETAVYEYDAAGNIGSIIRQNNPIVSLSGFIPNQEFVGNEITIQGTGFIADAEQNQVTFNGVPAVVTFAAVNELRAVVPASATAGKISVSNVNGSAESFENFLPLRTVVPNDPAQILNFDSVNRSYIFRFTGIGNQSISLLFEQINTNLQINVVSPSGETLISNTYLGFNSKIFIDKTLLPEDGEYEIEISSAENANASFSLYQFSDVTGEIPADETPLDIVIAQPGQNAVLNLNITEIDQPTYLNITSSAINAFVIVVKSPSGAIVKVDFSTSPSRIVQLENLPVAGNYKVEFDPESDVTGFTSFKYSLNAANSIIVDGPPLSLTILASQTGEVTFDANTGQRVFIKLNTGPFFTVNTTIIKPNGEVLDQGITDSRNNGLDINRIPETGTYRVVIDPMTSYGGDVTISATTTALIGGNCYLDNSLCFTKEIFAVSDQSVDLNLDVINADELPPAGLMESIADPKAKSRTDSKQSTSATNSLTAVNIEFLMSEVNVGGTITIFDAADNQVATFIITENSELVTFDNPGSYRMRVTPTAGQIGTFKLRVINLSVPPPGSQ